MRSGSRAKAFANRLASAIVNPVHRIAPGRLVLAVEPADRLAGGIINAEAAGRLCDLPGCGESTCSDHPGQHKRKPRLLGRSGGLGGMCGPDVWGKGIRAGHSNSMQIRFNQSLDLTLSESFTVSILVP